MKTTLNKLKLKGACKEGYAKLSEFLGGARNYGKDKDINLLTILESNGIEDTLWCFRVVEGFDKEKRLFAVSCARQIQHLLKDDRSINAINVAEKFAKGEATSEELEIAYAAANAANVTYAAAYAAAANVTYAAGAAGARKEVSKIQESELRRILKEYI